MRHRGRVPRPLNAAVKMVLVRIWLTALSILPGAVALGLFGGMAMMFIIVLADVACMDVKNMAMAAQ